MSSAMSAARNGGNMLAGDRKRFWLGLAFISPWLVGFLAFTVYPVAASFYYSFCDYDVLSRAIWLPLGLCFALALALLLNRPVAGRSLFRAIYYLPSLVPAVAAGAVWLWLLNTRDGLI